MFHTDECGTLGQKGVYCTSVVKNVTTQIPSLCFSRLMLQKMDLKLGQLGLSESIMHFLSGLTSATSLRRYNLQVSLFFATRSALPLNTVVTVVVIIIQNI